MDLSMLATCLGRTSGHSAKKRTRVVKEQVELWSLAV